MGDKKHLSDLIVKQEATSPTAKKILLSSSSFASLTNKNVSNARLPSFKPPRDLFLTGSATGTTHSAFNFNSSSSNKSTRKTFTPNVNVTRKRGSNDVIGIAPKIDSNSIKLKEREKSKVSFSRKKISNVVQTKGVFSEGLAPGRLKQWGNSSGEKSYLEGHALDKPKLNLNKKIQKNEEDIKLKSLLKDNFLDDPSQIPDITFIPKCLPMMCSSKVSSSENSDNLEKTFEMLQLKSEKISNATMSNERHCKTILESEFESTQHPKMFLFEFPSLPGNENEGASNKKKILRPSPAIDNEPEKSESLSSLGEGFFGYLRIHENGKAFLVCGKSVLPLHVNKNSNKQELVSTSINYDTMKGEVISLGSIDANITCSANIFSNIGKNSKFYS